MKFFNWYTKTPLIVLNIAAFLSGCAAGLLIWEIGDMGFSNLSAHIVTGMEPFGNILISMLKMIVIPIIFCSLVDGASSLPVRQFGKMGVSVILWYIATSLFAAIFGCIIAMICNPSLRNADMLASSMLDRVDAMQHPAGTVFPPMLSHFYNLFMNPFQALAEARFLPLIVFSILLGLAARLILDTATDKSVSGSVSTLLDGIRGFQHIVFKITDWVMRYFPIGIFALSAVCFAKFGITLFSSYFQVAISVIAGITLMILVCYPAIIFLICRENPYRILWAIREPIITAFAARSSAASLPVSMRTAVEKLHIEPSLSGFTLSLGATVNMDGVCIHLPVFAVLAANLFGFTIGPWQVFLLVVSVVFASIGAGGVPGGSIFLLFLVLDCFQLTPEQSAFIVSLALGINPLLDMFETACNVAGDNIGTYVIGKKLKLIRTE